MQEVLRHWESLDAVKWDDAERMEYAEFVESHPMSVKAWKEFLIVVPENVGERYRKIIKMLLDKGLINQAVFDAEMKAMVHLSPKALTRFGKELADWYRNTD